MYSQRWLLALLLSMSVGPGLFADDEENKKDLHGLRPPEDSALVRTKAEAARDKGLAFVVENQNSDGSWGSHDPRLAKLDNFGFQLKNRGSQDGVRIGCTAIVAQALLELDERSEAQEKALQRGIEALLSTEKIAYEKGESFNTWGYGYKLEFLTLLAEAEEGQDILDRIREAAVVCIEGLKTFQQHEGGWGYYSGPLNDFDSMSFNTAIFAVALDRAKRLDLPVPDGMIKDAVLTVQRQRVPDGSFVYSSSHITSGPSQLKNLGAGSRTAACARGLHHFGEYDTADIRQALDIFYTGENYLEEGRKLIQPHSASHQISGYFFFFGYYYAADIAILVRDDVSRPRWDRLVWSIIRTQEDNGCWWDTASGHYGEMWGSGFALLTLNRYLDATSDKEAEASGETSPNEGQPGEGQASEDVAERDQ